MNDGLRDIKPLLEIPDSSYYVFIALVALALSFVLGVLFFLFKIFWKKRKVNQQKLYLEELKSLDASKSKTFAYRATKLGRFLATEERPKEIYSQLVPMLEPYKYKKEVPPIDEQTLNQFNLLVHLLDESI